jgi:hypothetical protein
MEAIWRLVKPFCVAWTAVVIARNTRTRASLQELLVIDVFVFMRIDRRYPLAWNPNSGPK